MNNTDFDRLSPGRTIYKGRASKPARVLTITGDRVCLQYEDHKVPQWVSSETVMKMFRVTP